MNTIDLIIIVTYFLGLLGVGVYFSNKHEDHDDYFLGGRNIKSWHVGLSVVATDVGGGFSIGLGGLGFTIGMSGSWMLFTGLIGAWLSAVILIPKVKDLEKTKRFSTFNDLVAHFYGGRVALLATIISLIGYLGFTSSQLLAGAKLTSATFQGISMTQALWAMGIITVLYTAFGGLKAVIYTDTIQWIILIGGLIFVGIPLVYLKLGGWDAIVSSLPSSHMSFTEISLTEIFKWLFTIVPIWFIGLTLYQRIYACKDEKEAKKAWYLAGILEWPIMAFMGVILGVLAKVAYTQNLLAVTGYPVGTAIDSEMALPLLLTHTFSAGFLGLMMATYFSAILSTADSCLMASAGSVVSDILQKFQFFKNWNPVKASQIVTFVLGLIALIISSFFQNVLDLMLLSYGVMVSGLFIPIIAGLYFNESQPLEGFLSITLGGSMALFSNLTHWSELPIAWGLGASLFGFILGKAINSYLLPKFATVKVRSK